MISSKFLKIFLNQLKIDEISQITNIKITINQFIWNR